MTVRRLPFDLVVLVSLVVLFAPAGTTPSVYPGLDKLVHLGLFAALALTGRVAGLPVGRLVAGLLAYAAGSEVLQGVLPIGRDAEVLDAVVDVAGVVVGTVLARPLVAARR